MDRKKGRVKFRVAVIVSEGSVAIGKLSQRLKARLFRSHFYLKMSEEDRVSYLSTISDEGLLLVQEDVSFYNAPCELLDQEVKRRGFLGYDLESHFFSYEFLRERQDKVARIPDKKERLFKRAIFCLFKYSLFLCLIPQFAAIVLFGEMKNIPDWYMFLVLIGGVISLFVPLYLAGFNLFYRPASYMLIRPFNDKKMTRPLQKFIVKNIGLRCHGFTLSDKNYQPNKVFGVFRKFSLLSTPVIFVLAGTFAGVAVMVAIISTWVQQSVRIGTVVEPSGFFSTGSVFKKKWSQNARHFFCGGQCFNIRTIDEAWKYAAQYLILNSNFLIVDLSDVREGSEYELNYIQSSGATWKCIAICQEGIDTFVEKWQPVFGEVFFYDVNGRIKSQQRLMKKVKAVVEGVGFSVV